MKKRTADILAKSEKFVNPITGQEMFFSDQAIYVYNDHNYLVPLIDVNQIVHNPTVRPELYQGEEKSSPQFSPMLNESDSPFSQIPSRLFRNSPPMPGDLIDSHVSNTSPPLIELRMSERPPNSGFSVLSAYGYNMF